MSHDPRQPFPGGGFGTTIEALRACQNAPDNSPEREIPAGLARVRASLEHLLQTAEHLRERLLPALDDQPNICGAGLDPKAAAIKRTLIGRELFTDDVIAIDVGHILRDILDRLEV
jgi:hypothetical protein